MIKAWFSFFFHNQVMFLNCLNSLGLFILHYKNLNPRKTKFALIVDYKDSRFSCVATVVLFVSGRCHFYIKTTRKFFYLLLRVFLLKRKKIAIKPGPRAQTFCILNSLPYLTTLPNQLAKIPKKLSTYTSKLSFRTVTSITGDPSPFHNF